MNQTHKKIWYTFKRNRIALVGAAFTLAVFILALLAPMISPYDPYDQSIVNRIKPPSAEHPMGTDEYGRDVVSRAIWSARVSLTVGFGSVLIGLVVGTCLGVMGGYFGGPIETLIMRAVDVLLSFPTLVMGVMVAAILGGGLFKLILVIGIVFTPRFARLAYGPTLAVKQIDYVNAARVAGAGHWRIMLRHLVPNILGELLVAATLWLGTAIMIEASLSFLGLGISPPTPTWGNMIKAGVAHLDYAPWLCLFPGVFILLTVLSFNMIGDGLRDIMDPKLRG